jgi:hypothetical protein
MASVDEHITFWVFLRKSLRTTGALLTGIFSIPATVCSIYFPAAPLKFIFAILVVCSIVWACFQVWRESLMAAQASVAALRDANEKLKERPYDVEHRRLAENKVDTLSEVSKDLVWFLLHHGETEGEELLKRCLQSPEYNDAVQRAREAGFVLDTQKGKPGRASISCTWKINPEFENVLKDLLGNRKPVYFR